MRFKNITVILFAVLFLITLLCSCALGGTGEVSCAIHRDLDKNLSCDVCGEKIAFVCPGHTDADHDGICDTERCLGDVEVTHIDEDHNGFCDLQQCRQKMSVTHTDGNEDLVRQEPC